MDLQKIILKKSSVKLYNMCAIKGNDKVVIQNRKSDFWAGYAFPGGKIEKGESIHEFVVIEIYEETGLQIYEPSFCGIIHWEMIFLIILFFFKVVDFKNELSLKDNEIENMWYKISDLSTLKMDRGFEKHLKNLFGNEKLESLIIVFMSGNMERGK